MTVVPKNIEISRAALFLDFDGTLVAIADRPDLVQVTPAIRSLLGRLDALTGGALAIVSGRPITEIDKFLAPLVLPAAGSHGSERRDTAGVAHTISGLETLPATVIDALEAHATEHGLLLERKPGAAALHFRLSPAREQAGRELADTLVADRPELRVIHGNMVAEIVRSGRDKGSALRAFMTESPFAGRIPLAIGDDTTDEDMIVAAQALGGVGVRIGATESAARLRLADIAAFHDWLARSVAQERFDFGGEAQ